MLIIVISRKGDSYMSIYITGDTHAPIDIDKLSGRMFKEQKSLNKNDFVIICGDFGGVWNGSRHDEYCLDWFQSKRFTTLFCGGNHENYDLLYQYPVKEWNGGKIHKIRKSIFHLINGEVFELDGKRFFIMGGASSHDKEWRTSGVSWWPEEIPSGCVMEYGLENLRKYGNDVDYIITHCAPTSVQRKICSFYKEDSLTEYLDYIYSNVRFEKWFCGHYHIDKKIDNVNIVYNSIIKIS